MSGWTLIQDRKYPNAVTLVSPTGQKFRVTEYPKNGEVRFRIPKATPMVLRECYLTGEGQDAILTLAPGRSREEAEIFSGPVGEIVAASRRLSIGDTIYSALASLGYQVGALNDPAVSANVKQSAEKSVNEYLDMLSASRDQLRFLSTLSNQIPLQAYDLRHSGQMGRVKAALAHFVETWSGGNGGAKSIAETIRGLDSAFGTLSPQFKVLTDKWRPLSQELGSLLVDALSCLSAATRHEVAH